MIHAGFITFCFIEASCNKKRGQGQTVFSRLEIWEITLDRTTLINTFLVCTHPRKGIWKIWPSNPVAPGVMTKDRQKGWTGYSVFITLGLRGFNNTKRVMNI